MHCLLFKGHLCIVFCLLYVAWNVFKVLHQFDSTGLCSFCGQDAVSIAGAEEEPEAAARKLTETAFNRGSADNITCIVVKFHHEKAGRPQLEQPKAPELQEDKSEESELQQDEKNVSELQDDEMKEVDLQQDPSKEAEAGQELVKEAEAGQGLVKEAEVQKEESKEAEVKNDVV